MARPDRVLEAAARLRAGRLVAFPTETVYGLGADAYSDSAVARVYEAKGRPAINPLIVHVSGPAMAQTVTSAWTEEAETLAATFWPGPLTLVLPKAPGIGDRVTGGGSTVAVRVPDHPLAIALIEAFGGPIVGPSANPSGYVSPTRAEHVRGHFDEDTVFVLDGGPCRAGIESTVVTLVGPPRVLRPGVIGAGEIAAMLGRPVGDASGAAAASDRSGAGAASAAESPGLLGPHYQPRARVVVYRSMAELSASVEAATGSVVVLSPPGLSVGVLAPHVVFPMPGLAETYAAEFYAALREADEIGASVVLVGEPSGASPVWLAVLDRLNRAAQ